MSSKSKGKKKSRKPLNDDDENIRKLEEETNLALMIVKDQQEAHVMTQAKNPPVQLSVNVEVESCNENDIQDHWPNVDRVQTVDKCLDNYAESDAYKNMDNGVHTVKMIKSVVLIGPDTFNLIPSNVIEECNKIIDFSTNPVDIANAIEVRSLWGRRAWKPVSEDLCEVKTKIQKEIEANKKFLKEPIICYKCYICKNPVTAWWHLEPFKEHLKLHPNFFINIEISLKGKNIIAMETEDIIPEFQEMKIEGICPRCGDDYICHLLNKKVCRPTIKSNVNTNSRFFEKCTICRYGTNSSLLQHYLACHSVRTDTICNVIINECNLCHEKLHCPVLHDCKWKRTSIGCVSCHRFFGSRSCFNSHLAGVKDNVMCKFCDRILKKSCMVPFHISLHSELFEIVYYCDICNEDVVYMTPWSFNMHKKLMHSEKFPRRLPKLVVPLACIGKEPKTIIVPINKDGRDLNYSSHRKVANVSFNDEITSSAGVDDGVSNYEIRVGGILNSPNCSMDLPKATGQENIVEPMNPGAGVIEYPKLNAKRAKKNVKILPHMNISGKDMYLKTYTPKKKKRKIITTATKNILKNDDCSSEVNCVDDDDVQIVESHQEVFVIEDDEPKEVQKKPENISMIVNINETDLTFEDDGIVDLDDYVPKNDSIELTATTDVIKNEANASNKKQLPVIKIKKPLVVINTVKAQNCSAGIEKSGIGTKKPNPLIKLKMPSSVVQSLVAVSVKREAVFKNALNITNDTSAVNKLDENSSDIVKIVKTESDVSCIEIDSCNVDIDTIDKEIANTELITNVTSDKVIDAGSDNTSIKVDEESLHDPKRNLNEIIERLATLKKEYDELQKQHEALLESEVKRKKIATEFDYCIDNAESEPGSTEENMTNIIFNSTKIEPTRKVENEDIFNEIINSRASQENELVIFDDIVVKNEVIYSEVPSKIDCKEGDIISGYNETLDSKEMKLEKKDEAYIKYKSRINQKIYKCPKCEFFGPHRQYTKHRRLICPKKISKKNTSTKRTRTKRTCTKRTCTYQTNQGILNEISTFTCSKCSLSFHSLYKYLCHFDSHGYRTNVCPVCMVIHFCASELANHLKLHIRNSYFISKDLIVPKYKATTTQVCVNSYHCKKCRQTVLPKDTFSHWEAHLIISDEELRIKQEKDKDIMKNTKLDRSALETILDMLQPSHHLTTQHWQDGCIVCKRVLQRRFDYKRHLVEHLLTDALANRGLYNALRCHICSLDMEKENKFRSHIREHACLPVYKCHVCNKTFSNCSNFSKHKKIHKEDVLICDYCNKKFHLKTTLEKHILMCHRDGPNQFVCGDCGRRFSAECFYRKHRRIKHDWSPRHVCYVCKQRMYNIRDLLDHRWQVHGIRKEKADCTICDKQFRKYSEMKKHAKLEHNVLLKGRKPA